MSWDLSLGSTTESVDVVCKYTTLIWADLEYLFDQPAEYEKFLNWSWIELLKMWKEMETERHYNSRSLHNVCIWRNLT